MSDGVHELTAAQEAAQEKQTANEGVVHRDLVALDIFVNVLTGGKEDETISSRSSRDAAEGHVLGKVISKGLDLFQSNHGPKAQAGDMQRAKAIIETEEESSTMPVKTVTVTAK